MKTRTLANPTRWPEPKVEALSQVLKGRPPRVDVAEAFQITRSLQHGHVAAVLGTAARLEIAELIDPVRSRNRDLVLGMLAAQVIAPDSKLATARGLRSETATSSLGQVRGLGGADEDDLYAAMDWVLKRKDAIENRLAARHLTQGTLVLYDVSSAAFEGRSCPIAKIGHARDGVKGRWQIVYGLLATTAGVPVAIEVFEGNTADPKTLATQIDKLKKRFGLTRVCLPLNSTTAALAALGGNCGSMSAAQGAAKWPAPPPARGPRAPRSFQYTQRIRCAVPVPQPRP